jgi:hypothetical protein
MIRQNDKQWKEEGNAYDVEVVAPFPAVGRTAVGIGDPEDGFGEKRGGFDGSGRLSDDGCWRYDVRVERSGFSCSQNSERESL